MLSTKAFRDKLVWRQAAPSILLVVATFVWYLLTFVILNNKVIASIENDTEKLVLYAAYYFGIAVSAVVGAKLFSRGSSNFLYFWLFLGVGATFLLTGISPGNVMANLFFVCLFGASIGLGLPSCLSFFANTTSIENRGSIGGVIWSIVGVIVLGFAFPIFAIGTFEAIIVLTVWRLLSSIGFFLLNKPRRTFDVMKAPSYFELGSRRELILYLFPWVMFSIINFAVSPILENVFAGSTYDFVQLGEFAFIGIFAVIGGIFADSVGRKRVVILGFVMLGVEYAAMSIISTLPFAVYLFMTLDGITWGLLFSVFLTVIWGDLGGNYAKEKFYVLGGVPFLLAGFLSVLIRPFADKVPATTVFTFASFFLFVSVIPLMYAPETLPEKSMKDRELKSYLEKAQKFAQKETENNKKGTENKTENERKNSKEKDQGTSEDEEAKLLAEKYY